MYGTSIKIYTEENGRLQTKAHTYTIRNSQANCLSNGSEGWKKTEFLATEDGKLAKYDLQNRLTMIPVPEGVTRINQLKNTGYQLLMATNLGVVIYNPRTFKFDIINVQSPSQPLAEVERFIPMISVWYGHLQTVWE